VEHYFCQDVFVPSANRRCWSFRVTFFLMSARRRLLCWDLERCFPAFCAVVAVSAGSETSRQRTTTLVALSTCDMFMNPTSCIMLAQSNRFDDQALTAPGRLWRYQGVVIAQKPPQRAIVCHARKHNAHLTLLSFVSLTFSYLSAFYTSTKKSST